ncbi:hypothetical protein TNCV_344991 [Trichonephila clavipes]|nr:hypothetical protein TNCV_344991 [Trichonephila clavipes]
MTPGKPHNVLPGTVQGRSHEDFSRYEGFPAFHNLFGHPQKFLVLGKIRQSVVQPSPTTHATRPPHTLPRKDPFRCPISDPRGRG